MFLNVIILFKESFYFLPMKKDKKLKEIISTIANKTKPEKIYLFGSRGNGEVRKDSDYDILVVKKTKKSKYERIVTIHKLFGLRDFSMDVLVYTPNEIKEWKNATSSFIYHVLKTGKLVYEKQ